MPGRPRTWDTIPEMVLSTADRFGDAEAIVDGDHRITFEELTDKVVGPPPEPTLRRA